MTTTTPAAPLSATGVAPTTAVTNADASLGQNDFLQLLVAQLKYQDPMKPADSSEFMGEMAQFSTVQGVTSMSSTLASMSRSTDVSTGIAMIGKSISYQSPDGTTASGIVNSVSSADKAVTLHLTSGDVALTDVLGVSPGG
jgi:flagellar basal-body rod modification protein FlgD